MLPSTRSNNTDLEIDVDPEVFPSDEKTMRLNTEETLKNFENSKENNIQLDITKIIKEKRKEIQKLYVNNLGVSKYWRSKRKPSPLRRLEEGMINFFFKEDSSVLEKFPSLRRQLLKDEHQKDLVLNEKIDVGPLVYLYVKEVGNTEEARLTDLKSRQLKNSNNYEVLPDKDIVETEIQKIINENNKEKNTGITTIKENNDKSSSIVNTVSNNSFRKSNKIKPKINKNNYDTQTKNLKRYLITLSERMKSNPKIKEQNKTNKDSVKRASIFNLKNPLSRNKRNSLCFTPSKGSKIIPRLHLNSVTSTTITNTEEKTPNNNAVFRTLPSFSSRGTKHSNYITFSPRKTTSSFSPYKTTNLLTKNPRQKMAKSIISKAVVLEDHTCKLDGQLYKIIDSMQYNSTQDDFKIKDLEEIYDMNMKKKNEKDKAKDQVLQAVKIKDDYTLMDSDKAAMLKLSDDITKMPDEVALSFADRIVEAYYDRSDKVDKEDYKINPFIEKVRREKNRKLREKFDNNYLKIRRLGMSLEFKEQKLKQKFGKKIMLTVHKKSKCSNKNHVNN